MCIIYISYIYDIYMIPLVADLISVSLYNCPLHNKVIKSLERIQRQIKTF